MLLCLVVMYVINSLLLGLVGDMGGYCTSVYKYFPEPQARENTAPKCNIHPYHPLIQVISCLLHTSQLDKAT